MFHATVYGAVVSSAPRLAPSRRNCTPATPTLSDALAVTFTEPDTVAPAAGAVRATVGGVLSGAGGLATEKLARVSEVVAFPAVSWQRT